ncbi:endonuclease/exonuclease/phosphatase family protein [Vibrio sp. MACH09]|uniref:endonuclease/exonuclease/phosphatase family protein n=1 Tax=Vibrio sp. MACH09 TaxID=3025122 RepID=UPI00295EDDF3|nr:endonuclease/exonuclease/phosphatase family protein [Vibrio sp. MACH09]
MNRLNCASTFNISTLNLFNYLQPPNAFYQFDNIYSDTEWQRKVTWLSNCINELQSDVIAFQEVFSPDILKQQLNQLGYPHFVCLDSPSVRDGYQYSDPVLALASKHPILDAQLLTADRSLFHHQDLTQDFQFSRQPLLVSIQLGQLGIIDFVVVHFKSQRPTLTPPDLCQVTSKTNPGCTNENDYTENIMGIWRSASQRGFEANVLYSMLSQFRAKTCRPCIILGDFNQTISSIEFDCFFALSPQHPSHRNRNDESLNQLYFCDSWELYCEQFDSANLQWSRPATHYYGAMGKVLDYILLSNEFAPNSGGYLSVNQYHTYDEHIINPNYQTDHLSSDHAAVRIEIGIIK